MFPRFYLNLSLIKDVMKNLVIIFLLALALGCSKTEDKIKNYLESGKSLFEQGNYGKAKIEFKNVLQLDNKQTAAYYHLALIDEKNKNWQGMYANLNQVVQLDPKNNDAQLKLARLNLLSGQLQNTLKQTEVVLANMPGNADALTLKGAVLVKQNNLDAAMVIAEQVLKDHPDHNDGISLKTAIYIAKNDFANALATVEKGLQLKPNDVDLLEVKLQVHSQSKNSAALEQDYLNLIQLFPENLKYSYGLAKHYAENNQDPKALSTLQAIIDAHPDKLQPKLVLVDYQMQKSPIDAEKSLTEFLVQFPDEADLYFRLAGLYLQQNKISDAKNTLTKIVEKKPDTKESRGAMVMLAKLAMQENDLDTAKNIIKEVLAKDKKNLEAHLVNARLTIQSGQYDDTIADLRGVLRDYANSDDALVLLGQAYLKKNSPELADEHFRKALAINPANFDAIMPVVTNMLKNQDLARAEEVLQKALKIKPDHSAALQALAQIKLSQKDWMGAQKVADAIGSLPYGKSFSMFLSGKIAEQRGLCKEAVGQFKEALAISPELADALRSLATCYDTLKQNDSMYSYLDSFIKANPNNNFAPYLKSQLLTNNKRYDEALVVLTKALEKWPKASELYESAANLYGEKKNYEKALAIVDQGLANGADPIRMSFIQASLYEQSGAFDKALATYEAILNKNQNMDLAANNLVSLLLDHFDSKENVERAVSIARRFEQSSQPYFQDSYGWALFKSGRNAEALQVFKSVLAKAPKVPVFKYHIAQTYQASGNKAEAIKELEEALAIGAKSDDFAEKAAAEQLLKTLK
jgi:tetratricopeptide (TPR) repeat protein